MDALQSGDEGRRSTFFSHFVKVHPNRITGPVTNKRQAVLLLSLPFHCVKVRVCVCMYLCMLPVFVCIP